MCDLLVHILHILLLAAMWISWKRQRFSTFAWVWIQILQNIWHRTGFSCTAGWQNQIEQRWHSIINFYFPKLQRCTLRNVFFISNMTKAIELLEELLSSKLNLKITLLITVEAIREVLKNNSLECFGPGISTTKITFLAKVNHQNHQDKIKWLWSGTKSPSEKLVSLITGEIFDTKNGVRKHSYNLKVSENISGWQKHFFLKR